MAKETNKLQFPQKNTKMLDPKVSVIIAAYNSEPHIRRCLQSAMCQTYKNLEILIVDDNSDDKTVDQIDQLARTDDRIFLIQNKANIGAGLSRQKAIDRATGDYFAFLDADDFWQHQKIEMQLHVARLGPADIVYTGIEIVDRMGAVLGYRPIKQINSLADFNLRNPIPMSSALVRASICGARKMPSIRTRQDYAYWWKIYKTNNPSCIGINLPLTYYTKSKYSISANKMKMIKSNYTMWRIEIGKTRASAMWHVLLNIFGKFL